MRNYFIYDDERSDDYNLWIGGQGTYDAPERDVSKVSVPGRNGDIIFDNGRFENVKVKYPIIIVDDFEKSSEKAREWLMSKRGYLRLEDTYHPDEYRMATVSGDLSFDTGAFNKTGVAKLTFNCKPQRYLKSGDQMMILSGTQNVMNPTKFASKPLIRAYGSGNFTITINGSILYLYDVSDYYDIDFEKMMVYRESANKNNKFVGSFVELEPGVNTISTTGTKLEIKGRWWIV